MRYKIGDKVTIVGNSNEHEYPVGIEVTIARVDTSADPEEKEYYANHPKEGNWYVLEEDMTIEPTEEQKLLLAVYQEIWKDTVFQKCSHGLVANITKYLQSKGLIDKSTEI